MTQLFVILTIIIALVFIYIYVLRAAEVKISIANYGRNADENYGFHPKLPMKL